MSIKRKLYESELTSIESKLAPRQWKDVSQRDREIMEKLCYSWQWRMFFQCYPLPVRKIDVIIKRAVANEYVLNPSTTRGIMVDHLMSVARRLGIPDVYISEVQRCRRRASMYKKNEPHYYEVRAEMWTKTLQLLDAVLELYEKGIRR